MDELSNQSRSALDAYGEDTSGLLSAARRDAVWRAAVARRPSQRPLLKLAALAISCALGAFLFRALTSDSAPVPVVEEIRPSPAAQWRKTGTAVVVEVGQVRIAPQHRGSLTVTTPQLQAVVTNAAALFDVTAKATTLTVESGEVAWRARGKAGSVSAGGTITLENQAPPLAVAPRGAPLEGCSGSSESAAYASCLRSTAVGGGLAAEAALFELGQMAQERGELTEAVRVFRSYGARFAEGALAPEASISLMVDLRRIGDLAGATAEAARFSEQFANDPRREEVRAWAAQIP